MRIPPTLLFAATLSACASGAAPPPSPNHPASASAPEGTAYVPQPPAPEEGTPAEEATYVCPMHPEVTSDAPGTCPKCGMKLVPKN